MLTVCRLTKNHYSNHVRQSKWCLLLQRNVDITVRLLNAGAKVDQRDQHGNTPLILAAEHGNTDLMAVLLHYDAKIDVTNKDGWYICARFALIRLNHDGLGRLCMLQQEELIDLQ